MGAIVFAAAFFGSTGQALAAQLQVTGTGANPSRISFIAGTGETNAVTASHDGATRTMTISDPGKAITVANIAEPGRASCLGAGTDTVTCTADDAAYPWGHLGFDLGDGDDSAAPAASVPTSVTMVGGDGDDTLDAGSLMAGSTLYGDDRIYAPAGDGDDTLNGSGGTDSMDGGGGADTMNGAAGVSDAVAYARPASEAVVVDLSDPGTEGTDSDADGDADEGDSVSGAEIVYGGAGADRLTGDGGFNSLNGNGGDDVLDGGPGLNNDALSGGGGSDTAAYAGRPGTSPVVVTLGDANPDGEDTNGDGVANESDNLTSIENATGGQGDDHLTGDGAVNTLRGGGGADELNPAGGADSVFGDAGTDTLTTRDAGTADQVDCGTEADTASTDTADTVDASCESVSASQDSDGDGQYDDTDADDDNDGHADGADNCALAPNPGQEDLDGDAQGDACDGDDDGDGDADGADNCARVANPGQEDLDGDAEGDVCDGDDDGDGDADGADNCARVANGNQADVDRDGRGDTCDPRDDRRSTQTPRPDPKDLTAPALEGITVRPPRIGRRSRPGALKFSLSEGAEVTAVFERLTRGRRRGTRCRSATRRRRTGKRCTLARPVGELTVAGRAGPNALPIGRRIAGRKLAPGSYRVTITATDAAGNASSAKPIRFKIKRAKRRK
jgi:hypothetical protein